MREGVAVAVWVEVGVELAVALFVGVAVAVDVFTGVTVEVGVAVDVAVKVEVATGPPWVTTTSCGAAVPSREEKVTPSFPSATRANV